MKLYQVPLAPNPTKVLLYLAERRELGTKIDIEMVIVNPRKGEQRQPEHLARNPFGTLPVLELDDGSYLVESLSIIQYLEERFPQDALATGSLEEKARARDVERIADIRILSAIGGYVHATKSPLGLEPDPARAEQIAEGLQGPLDFMENLLADGRSLLMGKRVSVADCTLAAAFQFMRFAEADLLGDRPNLRNWDERYRSRPAALASLQW